MIDYSDSDRLSYRIPSVEIILVINPSFVYSAMKYFHINFETKLLQLMGGYKFHVKYLLYLYL